MGDIYDALMAARASNDALGGWVRDVYACDTVRDRARVIDQGIAAYERLQRDLRDGRKHVEVPDDVRERGPVAANLTKADEGYRLCETCEGVGTVMMAKMYPTGHIEVTEECPDCNGEGQLEIDEVKP